MELNPATYGLLFSVGLFVGMVVLLETGRRMGMRRLSRDPEGARQGVAAVEAAVFGLLGLLLAFTFSGAATRFDARRQLVVEEANDIGTAWLRLAVLPHPESERLRELFRQYLDARIATYQKIPDMAAVRSELAHSVELQAAIWTGAVDACRDSGSQPAHMLLLPALNEMFDIVTTRTEVTNMHPPLIIFEILGLLALASALLAGYSMAGGKSRGWVHMIGLAAVMAFAVYVIMDIEYPRLGWVRMDSSDQVLIDLRNSMR
jgi:hypothetical protein